MRTPTKAEEIEILREAAEKLGPDSYLGPYLIEQIPYLESMIRQDIFPDTFEAIDRDTRQRRRELEEWEARQKRLAREKQDKSEKEAREIIDNARRDAEAIRERARRAILAAIGD